MHLGYMAVDKKIILNCILKKHGARVLASGSIKY